MQSIILCLAFMFLVLPNLCAAQDLWTNLGPEGGAISAIAIDPGNPSVLYAGTASGRVFKSTNGGGSWSGTGKFEAYTDYGIKVYAMAVDPQNSSTVYAASGWLYKSTDGGATWRRFSEGIGVVLVKTLAIDPIHPSVVYAGTYSGGVFKTTDGGLSWSAANNGLSANNVNCLSINPQEPDIIFAGTGGLGGGLYKSVDGGASWSPAGLNIEITDVEIDPANPAIVYVSTLFASGVYTPPALHKSVDGGVHWTEITAPWQTPGTIAIDPQNPSVLYVGGYTPRDGAVKTADGGVTWSGVGYAGVIFRSFYVGRGNPAMVYGITDTMGIYRSADAGSSWNACNTGLSAMAVETVVFDPRSPAALYTAGMYEVLKSADGGAHWTHLGPLDNFMLGASYLVLDPEDPAVLYGGFGGLYKSTNGGLSWNRISLNTTIFSLAVDPSNASVLYAGTSDSGILKSTSGGASWGSAGSGIPQTKILSLAIDPKNTAVLYAGAGSGGIYKSANGGAAWTLLDTGFPDAYIQDIVINPQNTAVLFAVAGSGLMRSADGGATWVMVPVGAAVATVAIDPQRPSDMYAGTYSGVYRSIDGGLRWTAMNSGITSTTIRALAIDPIGRRIYAGTGSSGVWTALMDSAVEFHLNPGGAVTMLTSGDGELRIGYGEIMAAQERAPYGTAVFTFRQNNTVVSEAGVPPSKPTKAVRVFVDYRDGAPAVPARAGAGTVDVRTGIAVVNYSYEAANVTYTLRDSAGSTLAAGFGKLDPWHHAACFIDRLTDCGVTGFSLPANFPSAFQFGSLDIESDKPLSVLALRGTINQRDEFLITTTPVVDLEQSAAETALYFPHLADGGGYTTSLVLMNTSSLTERGTLQIRDKDGNPLTVNQTGGTADSVFRYSIPPHGIFRFQTDGFPAEVKTGWVRIVPIFGSGMPAGSGIFGYNPQEVLVSEAGIPSAFPVTHARIFVDLSGELNTGLAIANLTNLESGVTVRAYGRDGVSPAGSGQSPILLKPRGHRSGFAGELVDGLPAGFTGVLDISSAAPFAALTLRSLVNERGDFLMTTLPVADQSAAAPYPAVFPHLANGGGYTTQFILVGVGGAVAGSLVLFDESGESF